MFRGRKGAVFYACVKVPCMKHENPESASKVGLSFINTVTVLHIECLVGTQDSLSENTLWSWWNFTKTYKTLTFLFSFYPPLYYIPRRFWYTPILHQVSIMQKLSQDPLYSVSNLINYSPNTSRTQKNSKKLKKNTKNTPTQAIKFLKYLLQRIKNQNTQTPVSSV